jgi:PAS domain S-box-containing protein
MPPDNEKSHEQQIAEASVDAFRKKLGPFVVAAETTRMPMVFTSAKAASWPIIFVNQAFLSLVGYDDQEVLGQSFDFLMERGADPEAVAGIRTAFESTQDLDSQVRYRRKDGSVFWATIFISPVRDAAGDIVQYFASLHDITQHKEKEDHLHFLLDELNHRTQNTLAIVLAVARQTLRRAADKDVMDLFEGRILALSKAQSLLGSVNWDRVSLRDVIERMLQPFGLDDRASDRLSVQGSDVRLQPKAALTLAMMFHELATNAAKYGALSRDAAGKIAISWQVELTKEGRRLRLQWAERDGPIVAFPVRKGFGTRLIERGLAQDLDGEVHLDYAPSGVVCQLAMPLPEEGR